jgi:glycosyltransferase involved in cell wall biosynthesis
VVLSDTEDKAALAEALSKLANYPDLRQRMGQAARSVAEQHSWETMAQHFVDRFEELSRS